MKKKKQIEAKLKEKERELERDKYHSYSERKHLFNWVNILRWVLE